MNAKDLLLKKIYEFLQEQDLEVPQNKRLLESVIVELLHNIVPMTGATIFDRGQNSSSYLRKISNLLEMEPSSHRNKYSVYPFSRSSVSTAGPIFYYDKTHNTLKTLLLRKKYLDTEWIFPCGYMETYPTNTKSMLTERLDEFARSIKEEATEGRFLENEAQVEGNEVTEYALPDQEILQDAIMAEYRELFWDKGWQDASFKMRNHNYVKKALERRKVNFPDRVDVNTMECWIRETREETGIDLDNFSGAQMHHVKLESTIILGSLDGRRVENIDDRFCGYLGELEVEPALKAGEEIGEIAWLDVGEVIEKEKSFLIDNHNIDYFTIVLIEEALHTLLCARLKYVSNQLCTSPVNLQAHLKFLEINGFPKLKKILGQGLGVRGMYKSLIGREGMSLYNDSILVASLIAKQVELGKIEEEL